MKKVLLFKLLVLGALVVAGCSDKRSGDSSDYGLLGDDNSTIALNGQGVNGNKDSNTTKDDNGSSNDNNGLSGGNSDTNTTSGNGGKDSNTTNGGSSGGVDSNTTTGVSDTNSTGANSDTNSTNGNGDNNGISSGDDTNSTNGNGGTDGNTTGGGGNSGDTNTTNGNDGNTTTDDNTTLSEIKSINLKVAKTKLNKDTNTSIKVTAKTKDNKQIDVTNKVKWLINPKGAVIINKNTLVAKKDINTTIQAEYKNLISNKIKLNIYWEVNGHILPPEPDPKVNNATLLGVDVNKNGVRDDVERWIYKKYKDKHPIYIDIAMQAARGYKLVLEKQPKTREEAKSIRGRVDSIITCEGYYMVYAKYFNEPLLLKERIDDVIEFKYYNTNERKRKYIEYDKLLSGDVYPTAKIDINMKNACDFNTSKYNKE